MKNKYLFFIYSIFIVIFLPLIIKAQKTRALFDTAKMARDISRAGSKQIINQYSTKTTALPVQVNQQSPISVFITNPRQTRAEDVGIFEKWKNYFSGTTTNSQPTRREIQKAFANFDPKNHKSLIARIEQIPARIINEPNITEEGLETNQTFLKEVIVESTKVHFYSQYFHVSDMLHKKNADPNGNPSGPAQLPRYTGTPLAIALRLNNLGAVRALLEHTETDTDSVDQIALEQSQKIIDEIKEGEKRYPQYIQEYEMAKPHGLAEALQ